MLSITYEKLIPYPFEIVLSQYYDYEHIRHIHPTTLGEYHLVETRGNVTVYEQVWPRRFGRRARSLVRQEFFPPNEIRFMFVRGRYRGAGVLTRFHRRPTGTLVEETYSMGLPDWGWLRRLLRPSVIRRVDQIWEEDLRVHICRGGWPGLPRGWDAATPPSPT